VVGAVGMLAGFCGTLMTPMAANFNIVPAALLELKDRNAVVKAQIGDRPAAAAVNILIIYFAGFLMHLTTEIAARSWRSRAGPCDPRVSHKLDHVLDGADVLAPRVLHPIFFGSFDWHSCVHGWWTLLP
jgi:hypothetical protein